MRILIDLRLTEDERVEGVVSTEASDEAVAFSGWLELLAVLETVGATTTKGESPWRQTHTETTS